MQKNAEKKNALRVSSNPCASALIFPARKYFRASSGGQGACAGEGAFAEAGEFGVSRS
jgi:hypothetical protein